MRLSRFAALALLAMMVSTAPARALPPLASGSSCSANWVNNAGALACFTQGEEEANRGVSHPHYVACTANGDVFCCVNNDQGHQDCEFQSPARKTSLAAQLRALLNAQRLQRETMNRLSSKVEGIDSRLPAKPQ